MEYEKELRIILWIVALFGMFFVARGITGNITGNAIANGYSISDYCSNDKDCLENKICCMINNVGMCADLKTCNEIKDFTKEKPEYSRDYNSDIIFGILILICVLIAIYSATTNKSKTKKAKTKKITKKKKIK